MRSQWWWLGQLLIAFQHHVRNAEMHQQVSKKNQTIHSLTFIELN